MERVRDVSELEGLHAVGGSPCFVFFLNRLFPCCRALKPVLRDLRASSSSSGGTRLLRVDLDRTPDVAWLPQACGLGEGVVVLPTVIAAHTSPPARLSGGSADDVRAFVAKHSSSSKKK